MVSIEVSTAILALCTIIYTLGTLLLWYSTHKTTRLVERQISLQTAANRSAAWHNLLDSHRDLYLQIISNDKLLKSFGTSAEGTHQEVREKYLATLMINHALRIYLDYENRLDMPEELEGYVKDLQSMLQFGFVKNRWEEIREYYPSSFKEFMEQVKVLQFSKQPSA